MHRQARNLGRRIALSVILLGGCTSTGRAAADLTLDQVISRHTQARGGAVALDAVRNVLVISEITEPKFQVLGRYIASIDMLMRVDIYFKGAWSVTEAIDAEGEWFWDSDKPAPEPDTEVAIASGALRHGILFNVFGLHALPARGQKLTLEGRETIDGVSYYKVKLTLDDGFETWRYINPTTWMIDYGRDYRPLHPDADPTPVWIQTRYEDYRPVDGVQSSFRWVQHNLATGELMQTGVISKYLYNVPADELNFSRQTKPIAP